MSSTPHDNDLDIKAIDPRRGAKFSPNLSAFLKRPRNEVQRRLSRVYRDLDGTLWLGYPDEDYFIGTRLMAVLCNGAKTDTMAYPRMVKELVEVERFWINYMRDGRCAIDAEHKQFFIGDDSRWSTSGETRSCNWCGKATQRMKRWTEVINKSGWVDAAAVAA